MTHLHHFFQNKDDNFGYFCNCNFITVVAKVTKAIQYQVE